MEGIILIVKIFYTRIFNIFYAYKYIILNNDNFVLHFLFSLLYFLKNVFFEIFMYEYCISIIPPPFPPSNSSCVSPIFQIHVISF